ncbi:MAG TPA: LCCL domain-containing protein [Rhodothermales bacterium]|nr:LCCL domain-containing protein [Rhodothermales bacterium]
MRNLSLCALALAFLAGCGSGTDAPAEQAAPGAAPAPPPPPATPVDWLTNAATYQGQNGTVVTIQCAANPSMTNVGPVWGTDTYSDDSAMCVAAVHAGIITPAAGGRVAVTIAPGQDAYTGSERNGVITGDWPVWPGSFTVAAG